MNYYRDYNRYGNYHCRNLYNGIFVSQVPVSDDTGFIRMNITKDLGRVLASDAVLTIYVNQNGRDVPVLSLSPTQNPTVIELPIAHPLGTLVEGPEYYFTPYSLSIEEEGYYRVITQNIRLFPNTTSSFLYNLNKVVPGVPNHDEITVIPPHPRDQLK